MPVHRTIQILALLGLGAWTPLWSQPAATTQSAIRIILVGDSTVALHNGWGPGFCALASPDVTCLDLGKNGRSSRSYRDEGSWDRVMNELKAVSAGQETYVLIQFGHNDQPGKPGRSTDLTTEFPANMRRYVQDVKSTGAKAVLITPLTRRSFKNGQLKNDLAGWADATRRVAREEGVPHLELNAESWAAVQKMGAVEANTLAMAPAPASFLASAAAGNSLPAPKPPQKRKATGAGSPSTPVPVFDYTHLGEKGSAFFGRMVARELIAAAPGLAPYFKTGVARDRP
jgi:lysophospholipase L1-like esterase